MSSEEKKPADSSKISRRRFLEVAGGAAAGLVVGAVSGYLAGVGVVRPVTVTTTVTAPATTVTTTPPPPSLKPPLSPEVKERVNAIVKELIDRHAGETIVYAGPTPFWSMPLNGFFKVRMKDGVITSIEPDDTIHADMPREDEDWDAVMKGTLRVLGNGSSATRTFSYPYYLYRPERLIYPMKRVGPRGDPHAKFVRISWDEALSTIANKMKEIKEKYGPYSIAGFYTSPFWISAYIGAGCTGWGIASNESHNFAREYVYGGPTAEHEIQDIFNTKLIIIWSADPTNTNLSAGPIAYYIKLAKERGIPVICIDPRFNKSAATLADQWIPIRPGTDVAMMLAMANVIFKEDLYDKEYVSKYVEPRGFELWRDYVLGKLEGPDGKIDRTPEWAEKICGVPAETIRELARLYARSKPTWMIFSWCAARIHRGENPARAAMYLQAMMGNIGIPGGYPCIRQGGALNLRATSRPTSSSQTYGGPFGLPPPGMFGNVPPEYNIPVLFKNYKWADAVLLREKFDKGELSKEEYHAIIGNPIDNPTPNIKFVWFHSNLVNQNVNISKQIEAIKKLEFCVVAAWHMDQPTALLADIVLPRAEVFEEDFFFSHTSENSWAYAPKLIKPPGEVKSILWIMVQLAKKLGVIDKFAPELANVSDEEWDRVMEEYAKKSYEEWRKKQTGMPDWEEFVRKPIYREPTDVPIVGFSAQIQQGTKFPTPSGKIEFYSEYLATTDLTKTKYGGPISPYAVYEDIKEGYFDPKVEKYPLMLISPHGRYRMHSWQDADPMLNSDVYRHSIWISVADAKVRNIKDGDLVRVYNDLGEIVLPAYVTSKIVPGTVCIFEGGWYRPNRANIDRRGAPCLLHPDVPNPDGQWPFHGLVEVEKF